MVRKKRTKVVATRHDSPAENIPKCVFGSGAAPDPAGGAFDALPGPLPGFKGGASRRGRGGQGGEGRRERKGREGEDGKGREGEERERLEFDPPGLAKIPGGAPMFRSRLEL